MADTLTAFDTLKYNPSGLTPGADPNNRKALDGLTASEIKIAAGLPCRGAVESFSNENQDCFWARQERNSPFDTKG